MRDEIKKSLKTLTFVHFVKTKFCLIKLEIIVT